MSTCAGLARCLLRSSSSTRHRRQSVSDDSQLALPFLADSEISAPAASVADHAEKSKVGRGLPSSDGRWRGETVSSPVAVDEKPSASDQNQARKATKRKPPATVNVPADAKLLVSRREAAVIVSLSLRKIDSLLATKQLPFRKIGTRTLIPLSALQRFARMDHAERLAS